MGRHKGTTSMCLKKEKFLGLIYLPRKIKKHPYFIGSVLRQLNLLKGNVCLLLPIQFLCLRYIAETIISYAFV